MTSQQKGRQRIARMMVLGALLVCGAATAVQAETLPGNILFQSSTMVTSANINLTELDITTPGTLYVSLSDVKWPSALNALSFTLFNSSEIIGTKLAGNWTFDIASPSTFFASIFASPGSATAGLYNVQINFQSAVAPVPLPAAAWLLLSGIAGLAAVRPKQKLSQTFA